MTRRRKSRQRDRILELIENTTSHPTATWVYDNLRGDFPSVSLGNVYRNLSILENEGKIRRLTFGSTFDRYEAADSDHAHFVCDSCGTIHDLPADGADTFASQIAEQSGHIAHSFRFQIHGTCKSCLSKATSG